MCMYTHVNLHRDVYKYLYINTNQILNTKFLRV